MVAASLAVLAISTDVGQAASRVCRQLEAELASASTSGRQSSQVRRYDSAIIRQREQLDLARSQSSRAGCGLSFFGGSRCSAVNAKIDKMEANLVALERKRAQLAATGSGRSRGKILAAIEANRCRGGDSAESATTPDAGRSRELIDQVFGGSARQREALKALSRDDLLDGGSRTGGERNVVRILTPSSSGFESIGGDEAPSEELRSYRTLCVRTCDGYFFPMSPASSLGDLARDQKSCEAACPGTDVDVYYQGAKGAETADMVSAKSGARYSDLANAYLYREQRPPACGCNQPRGFEIVGGAPPPVAQSEPVVPVPVSRPDPAADPETLANAAGGFDAEAMVRSAAPPPPKVMLPPPADGERKVRVVGPVFLPDPEAAIDLRAPARREVR